MWKVQLEEIKTDQELYAIIGNRLFHNKFKELYRLPAYCFDDKKLLERLISKMNYMDSELFVWGDEIARLIKKYKAIEGIQFINVPNMSIIEHIRNKDNVQILDYLNESRPEFDEYDTWDDFKNSNMIPDPLIFYDETVSRSTGFFDRLFGIIQCTSDEELISRTERYYIKYRIFPGNITETEFYEIYNKHENVTIESIKNPELEKILINKGFH